MENVDYIKIGLDRVKPLQDQGCLCRFETPELQATVRTAVPGGVVRDWSVEMWMSPACPLVRRDGGHRL